MVEQSCLDQEETYLFNKRINDAQKKSPYLEKYVKNLKKLIKPCNKNKLIDFVGKNESDELTAGSLIYLTKELNENYSEKGYLNLKSKIIESKNDSPQYFFAEDYFGRNLVLEIVISWNIPEFKKIELLKLIEDTSIDFQAINFFGNNALSIACSNENINLVKYLLEQGVSPGEVSVDGRSCLREYLVSDNHKLKNILAPHFEKLDSYEGIVDWTELIIDLIIKEIFIEIKKLVKKKLTLTTSSFVYLSRSLFEFKKTNKIEKVFDSLFFDGSSLVKKKQEFLEKIVNESYFRGEEEVFNKYVGQLDHRRINALKNVKIENLKQLSLYNKYLRNNNKLQLDSIAVNDKNLINYLLETEDFMIDSTDQYKVAITILLKESFLEEKNINNVISLITEFQSSSAGKKLNKDWYAKEHLKIIGNFLPSQNNFLQYKAMVDSRVIDFRSAECKYYLDFEIKSIRNINSIYRVILEKSNSKDNFDSFFALGPSNEITCAENGEVINFSKFFSKDFKYNSNFYGLIRLNEYLDSY